MNDIALVMVASRAADARIPSWDAIAARPDQIVGSMQRNLSKRSRAARSGRVLNLALPCWCCLLLAVLGLFSLEAGAGPAPSIFYRVSNDGVNTDRFPSPEEAGRVSIERKNFSGWSFHSISPQDITSCCWYTQTVWNILYMHTQNGQTSGPYGSGSSVQKFFVCDPTPMMGPNYGADVQGLPKNHSTNPNAYANGCPIPAVDLDKNLGGANCAGNPINVGIGNKYQEEVDYQGSESFPLTLVRRYNSLGFNDSAYSAFRLLGPRWRHSYERTITLLTTPSITSAAAMRPDGRVLRFTLASGIWVSDADVTDQLERIVDASGNPAGWLYRTSDDSVEVFNLSGRLLSIADRSGNTQALTYSDGTTPATIAGVPGLLISVSDSFGRTLQFTYDSRNRLATMADPAGQLYSYAYDATGNLQSITYPDARSRVFLYNEPAYTQNKQRPNHLTGIVDESQNRFAYFGYDAYGRAISTAHAGDSDVTTVAYTYNSSSNVVAATITDALGTTRTRDFQHSLGVVRQTSLSQSCTGGCNAAAGTTYDANGNTASRTDFNGHRICYAYDLTRNLETVRVEGFAPGMSCPANLATYTPTAGTRQRKISAQWHTTFRLPTQIDEPGKRTTFTHDASGNVLTKTVLDTSTSTSRTWTYTYNSFGQVLTADGPRTDVSDVTTYTYYSCTSGYQCGQVATITNALGHLMTYNIYNAHGQPLMITDPNGVVTTLTYDLRQRLTSRTVGSEQTTFEYWPTGLLKKATLPDSSFLQYTYDAAHRLTQINDAEGNRIAYTLDAMGNRTAENLYDPSNALTQTRTRVFNTLNQLWKQIGAAGTTSVTTTFSYDNNGNQTGINAPLSRNTTQAYDELNRLKQVTDPLSGVTQYGYNALDQLISVTDPRSKVTSYTYNALGDLTQQVSPDTGTTSNTYDAGGNLATSTDARNKTATYGYDALNRVTSLSYPDQTISYTYDGGTNQKGRLTQLTDASGSTRWSYDAQDRVLSRQQSMGVTKTLSYAYDSFGRLQTLTLPSGNTVSYGYTNGQVTSLTLNGSTTILSNVLYEPFGPTRGWTWGSSTLAIREYDTDGKITDLDSAGLKTYSYDDAFRITGIVDATNSSLSQSYGYDLLDRLTNATGTSLNQGWTYDANGNRLTQSGSQASTYTIASTNNRLSSITGALTRSYGYDNAGNTTSDGSVSYTYNDAGRMTSATKSGITTTYAINALGQRVKKTTSGSSTYFVYDEAGHLIGEYDNAGSLIQETVWLGDIPVATLRPSGGGGVSHFYVHADHLNTPRRISRPSDDIVVWRWDSDPFGTSAVDEDPDGDSNLFAYNQRFPGQYLDRETELHYNYFRDYDPSTGRYVERDPAGRWGDPNQYSYAYADPIRRFDTLGLVCGSKYSDWIVPDSYRGASFADCCRKHDGCYDGCPLRPSLSRASCDTDFRSCVKEKCRGMGSLLETAICEMVAETFASAVSTFGQDPYEDARAQSSKDFASHLVTSPSLLGRFRPR